MASSCENLSSEPVPRLLTGRPPYSVALTMSTLAVHDRSRSEHAGT